MESDPNVVVAEGEPAWLEQDAVAGFRVWEIMFICFSGLLCIVVMLCCCIRFRIPRTKQDIEADYQRKKLAKKFRQQLGCIRNNEMDNMDLKKALERVRAEFKSDTESDMEAQASESIYSVQTPKNSTGSSGEDQTPMPMPAIRSVNTLSSRIRLANLVKLAGVMRGSNHEEKN